MSSWLFLLGVLAGCSFHPAGQPAPDGLPPADGADAPPDVPTVVPLCAGTFATVCVAALPTAPRVLNTSLDTDNSPLCDVGATPSSVCVVSGTSITIAAGSHLFATGSRPLVLWSASTITVAGLIDVGSHTSGTPQAVGAGGDASACVAGTAATKGGSGGGGYGGSFGGTGARGESNDGGSGGTAPAASTPTAIRGGCAGGAGAGPGGGAGGHGGGAVALVAHDAITVSGAVNASGGGGKGATGGDNGAGGGGSGGADRARRTDDQRDLDRPRVGERRWRRRRLGRRRRRGRR